LKNLLLGRYGPLPFYKPEDWIYENVLEYQRYDGKKWPQILADEGGIKESPDADLATERRRLEGELERPVSDEELVLYLQFPFDALSFFKFQARYGKAWLLPPEVWFRCGGFRDGEHINFADEFGVPHDIEVISTRREGANVITTLMVDHSFQTFSVQVEGPDKSLASR
jgi:pyruvate carboxylase